jgi:hypothetical protein
LASLDEDEDILGGKIPKDFVKQHCSWGYIPKQEQNKAGQSSIQPSVRYYLFFFPSARPSSRPENNL